MAHASEVSRSATSGFIVALSLAFLLSAASSAWPAYSLKTSFPNGVAGGRAGTSVAIVGPNVFVGIPGQNRVNVYDRLDGTVVKTFVSPTNAVGDDFGAAIAPVGTTMILVGAPGEDDAGNVNAGVAYLLDQATGAVIKRFTKPVGTPANSFFGNSVVFGVFFTMIGAYGDDDDAVDSGAVYIFGNTAPYPYYMRIGNPTPGVGDTFGSSLYDVRFDGVSFDTLLVGAPRDDSAASDSGALYVYKPTGSVPAFALDKTIINPTAAANSWFGFSLWSGPTLPGFVASYLVGAPFAVGSGRAYIVNATSGAIAATLQGPTNAGFDLFGQSVAIANNNLVVGAPGVDVGQTDAGQAYVFSPNAPYAQTDTLANPAPGAGDFFGFSMGGGTRLAVGARADDTPAVDSGAAYLFETAFSTACWTSSPASAVGAWDPPKTWPTSATHASLVSTPDDVGKVLFFHGHGVSPTWLWDPGTGQLADAGTATGSTFCGGHVALKDGRIMEVGGTAIALGNPEDAGGLDLNNHFDPVTGTWSVKQHMLYERWYPTATTLGDGRVLVSQGTDGTFGGQAVIRSTPEVYDPRRDCWRAVTPTPLVETETYPMMFFLPDGSLFQAGRSGSGSTMTRRFSLSIGPSDASCSAAATGTWTNVGNSPTDGSHGSAVLYRAGEHGTGGSVVPAAKILKVGGLVGQAATSGAAVIDMNLVSPSWTSTNAMNAARTDLNLVTLPTGQVLAIGGQNTGGPVVGAELWNPQTGAWTKMACIAEPRMYHSSALLLPDATVVAAGGDPLFGPTDYPSYQVYKPAYLFSGLPRPTIASAPAEVTYGNTFEVGVGGVAASEVDKVVLIRPGSVTHAFDMNGRYVPVAFATKNATTLTVTAPASSGIAPEGQYMLFLLRQGMPSKAVFVTVAPAPTIIGSADTSGTADANDVFVLGDYAYVVTDSSSGPEFYVFDVGNPSLPVLVGSYDVGATVNKVVVDGNRAFLATADATRELLILDVTNKAVPTVLGAYDSDEALDGIAVAAAGNTVCLGTKNNTGVGDAEFYVLDVANPGSPALLGSYDVAADVNDIDLNGETAFLATAATATEFLELNIANPAAISVVSSADAPGATVARGVDYHDGRLYGVTNGNAGQPDFFVWNAPAGGALTQVGALNLGSTNRAVQVYNGRAFVATTTAAQRLAIVDVRDPAAPVRESALDLAGNANGIAVKDARAYIATTYNAAELRVVSSGLDLEPTLTDINGDGFVTVSCLGDSNTAGSSWCPQLDGLFTQTPWRTINHGVAFATGFEVGNGWPDSFEQLPVALANDAPEAIIVAFGTNDITFDINIAAQFGTTATPGWLQSTVDAYETLKASAEATGAKMFIATTPPRNEASTSLANHLTLHLNNRIRHEFPRERIIDFHTPIVTPDDFADALHMNAAGQTKRAQAALHELEN